MTRCRVLALTRYGDLGASSRVRMLQFIPHLRSRGVSVEAAPLLSNAYVRRLYAGRRPDPFAVAGDYLRRLAGMIRRNRYDALWIEKELLPWLPYAVERLVRGNTSRIVVDYDDAVWLRYSCHHSPLVRRLLGRKIERVMAAADIVTAGNNWLKDCALRAGTPRAIMIPSVVDTDRYRVRTDDVSGDALTVGWIGSPETVRYLRIIAGAMQRVRGTIPIRFICVGVNTVSDIPGVECRPWSSDTEVAQIQQFDVGVMPLSDADWERGKCGYKLIQYMACGVPAIGSAVGANLDIISDGQDGFLAATEEDWIRILSTLARERELRTSVAASARSKVERQYSVESRIDQVAGLFVS